MTSADGIFRCFVSGLDYDTTEKDLGTAFSNFGNVIDSKIIHETGRFGFVTFEEEKSMRDAIMIMNDHGQKSVEFQCYVHGLGCDTDAKCLESKISEFGDVLDSHIIYDRETGISKGFGFVTYKDEKSMRDAIMLMNGHEIDGCNITAQEARRRNGVLASMIVKEGRPHKISRAERAQLVFRSRF